MGRRPFQGSGRVQRFGSRDTAKKQSVVVRYLAAYLRVMSKQQFHLSYVDAFAGCGARIEAGKQSGAQAGFAFDTPAAQPKENAALEALRLKPGFDRYVFGDRNKRHIAALRQRIDAVREAGETIPEVDLLPMDANELVHRECGWLSEGSNRRAVMFLDPYGMQVEWTTLCAVAATPGIDLWLLLPTGIAVNRLVPWKRQQHPLWAQRLDAFYGSGDWRRAFMETDRDMLGAERQTRSSELDEIVRFTISRLQSLFGEGLYPEALPLKSGRKQAYHLIFANSSKQGRAREIAHKIAGHLMRKAQAGS